ncbi:MAG: hypothetical protein K8R19_12530 [Methanosarcinales archaeon]|jgi:hypothetical protein|nr:hypothetical protein [Methanosarcinales archaeon]
MLTVWELDEGARKYEVRIDDMDGREKVVRDAVRVNCSNGGSWWLLSIEPQFI